MTPSCARFWGALTLIFVLALALRVGITARLVGLDSPPDAQANSDQVDYEFFAAQMAAGQGYTKADGSFTACRPPGTSLMLLPAYLAAGHDYAAGRLWFCVLSALTCVLVAEVVRPLLGHAAAILSALILTFYPGHFYPAMHFLSETPYAFWLILAVGATLAGLRQAGRPTWAWHALAGAAWALAILCRPQLVFALPIALGLAALALWQTRHEPAAAAPRSPRAVISAIGVPLLMLVLIIGPWVGRNALVMGKATLSTVGGHTFWGANNELVLRDHRLAGTWVRTSDLRRETGPLPQGEIAVESAAWRHGVQFVRRHPADMPYLTGMKLYRLVEPFSDTPNRAAYWAFGLSWLAIAGPMVLGAAVLWRRHRTAAAVVLLPVAGTVLCAAVFYGSARFRDSLAPVLAVLAAAGLQIIGQTVLAGLRGRFGNSNRCLPTDKPVVSASA